MLNVESRRGPGVRQARPPQRHDAAAVPFAASYLAIWTLAGVVAYALDRPRLAGRRRGGGGGDRGRLIVVAPALVPGLTPPMR